MNGYELIVVRRPLNSNDSVRIGAVLSGTSGGRFKRVRWEDTGEEEEVRSDSRTSFAVRGSLRHQWLVDPGSLPDLFAADPRGLVLRLLRETGSMTATRVKDELAAFGLDERKVAAAWTAAQKRFATSGEVKAEGKGSARTYVWVGPVAAPKQPGGTSAEDAANANREAERAITTATTEPRSPTEATPSGKTPAGTAPADGSKVERTDTFADAFARVFGDDSNRGIDHFAKRPLQAGVHLGRLGESAVSELVASLTSENRPQALALFLAIPNRVEVIDASDRPALLDPATVDAVLEAAVAELDQQPDVSPASRTAAGWLVRRASIAARPSASVALVAMMAYIADGRERDVEALDLAAHALSRNLPRLQPDARNAIDFGKLAAAVAHVPLQPKGGRLALLATVAKVRPESIADDALWSGVTLQALVDCASAGLGAVTSLPLVAQRVLRPLLLKEVSMVTSRRRLAWILGLPQEFAAQLPPDSVAAAFRQVANDDRVVTEWVQALADDAGVDALKNELKQATDDAAAARQHADASEQRERELIERCDRLDEMLRREHTQAVEMRASQERQIRIDVVRALADLAAEVEELAVNHTAPQLLIERVRSLVAAQALEPVGVAGRRTNFDPTQHKPIVGNPEADTAVSVLRPGYRWRSSGEDILIHKALVTVSQED